MKKGVGFGAWARPSGRGDGAGRRRQERGPEACGFGSGRRPRRRPGSQKRLRRRSRAPVQDEGGKGPGQRLLRQLPNSPAADCYGRRKRGRPRLRLRRSRRSRRCQEVRQEGRRRSDETEQPTRGKAQPLRSSDRLRARDPRPSLSGAIRARRPQPQNVILSATRRSLGGEALGDLAVVRRVGAGSRRGDRTVEEVPGSIPAWP